MANYKYSYRYNETSDINISNSNVVWASLNSAPLANKQITAIRTKDHTATSIKFVIVDGTYEVLWISDPITPVNGIYEITNLNIKFSKDFLLGVVFQGGYIRGKAKTGTLGTLNYTSLTYTTVTVGSKFPSYSGTSNNEMLYEIDYVDYLTKFLISSEDEYYSISNGANGISIFPKMESRYAPYGEAQHNTGSLADGWKAFDKNPDTFVKNNTTGYNFGRVRYIFPNNSSGKVHFDRLKYKVGNGALSITMRFVFVDGTSFYLFQNKTISKVEDEISLGEVVDGDFTSIEFSVNFPSNSHPTIEIYEFDLIETIEPINRKIVVPTNTEEFYLTYGLEKESIIESSSKIGEIQYVEKDNSPLGLGKVFKQKIDTVKIPIKKASIT